MSCLCYVISIVCIWVCVLWVLISLSFWVLISLCPFGVDSVFLDWFLCFYVLLSFDFCILRFVISQFSSFASNLKLPDGFDLLNRWLKPPGSTRAFSWLRVHFMFTQANWVGCKSTQNSIWPYPWTTLVTSVKCPREILILFLVPNNFIWLQDSWQLT